MSVFQSNQQGKYTCVMFLQIMLWEPCFTGNLHLHKSSLQPFCSVLCCRHQGLCVEGNPKVFDQFVLQHKCNYFCGLLGMRSLKVMDFLSTPTKPKGSKSPLLQRKKAVPSSSPQTSRKVAVSPRMPRKAELEGSESSSNQKDSVAPNVVNAAQTWQGSIFPEILH